MSNFMNTDISPTLRVSTVRATPTGFETVVYRATISPHAPLEVESRRTSSENEAITTHAELVACWTVRHIVEGTGSL